MERMEFYQLWGDLFVKHPDGSTEAFTEKSTDLMKSILDYIEEFYPDAVKALKKEYRKSEMNIPYFRFRIVNRFLRCNFGNFDNEEDVDARGMFHFEKVQCPLRGECKWDGIICQPTFNSTLSQAELRVMECIYNGFSNEETADNLILSINTVKNHIKNVYRKLGIHEKAEFIRYANDHKLFKDETDD